MWLSWEVAFASRFDIQVAHLPPRLGNERRSPRWRAVKTVADGAGGSWHHRLDRPVEATAVRMVARASKADGNPNVFSLWEMGVFGEDAS